MSLKTDAIDSRHGVQVWGKEHKRWCGQSDTFHIPFLMPYIVISGLQASLSWFSSTGRWSVPESSPVVGELRPMNG